MNRTAELRWWIGSVAVHAVLLAALALVVSKPGWMPWPQGEPEVRADTVMMVFVDVRDTAGREGRRAGGPEVARLAPASEPAPAARPDSGRAAPVGVDVGAEAGDALPPLAVTPGYGDGRLWVRPGAVLARGGGGEAAGVAGEAGAYDPARHVASLDSALSRRLLAYLDTLPADSFAIDHRVPSWTTEVNGRTWGIDQQWIYLGDLKLPTALLALLPMPAQANWEEGQRAAHLMRVRQDILQAAARAESSADFRRYVNELRERRDAERRLEAERRNEQ